MPGRLSARASRTRRCQAAALGDEQLSQQKMNQRMTSALQKMNQLELDPQVFFSLAE